MNSRVAPLSAQDLGRARTFGVGWIIWLPFLVPDVVELLASRHPWPEVAIGLGGGAVFVAIYLWATWRNVLRLVSIPPPPEPPAWQVWLPIGALILLSIALTSFNGLSWGATFIYTSAYAAARLPPWRALLVVALLVIIVGAGELNRGSDLATTGTAVVFVGIVGTVVLAFVQGITTDRELRTAQAEIARLAVTTERLRIARDLHDLLGHNLTLIALKSDLAGSLANVAPERAAAENADIAQVARATLQQVREALAGYRQPALAGELQAAQQILAAAGIAFRYEGGADPGANLPPTVEAVLSWTVREGVTNVVKHSRACECVIRASRDLGSAGVEVADNGAPGAAESPGLPGGGGTGLRGLAERVRTLGGQFEAGPCPGGFRLAVAVPVMTGDVEGSKAR